jgi:DNA gyrase subunit B
MASEGIESVRKRPGMYCGGNDAAAVHTLLVEVLANAVREQLTGHGSRVDITLRADGSCTVSDDGRGISVEPERGMQFVLTKLHAGGHHKRLEIPGAKYGIGLCVVNALSERFSAKTRRNGSVYEMRFRCGEIETPLARLGPTEGSGTEISFVPDRGIFRGSTFDVALIEQSIGAITARYPNATITFVDARDR